MTTTTRQGLQQATLDRLAAQERQRFIESNPQSKLLADRCAPHWLFGVPLQGSLALLVGVSVLYLLVALGMGLVL